MQSFIDGMRTYFNELQDTVREAARIASDELNNALEIHSPSKLFRRKGQYTMQGLIIGLEDEGDALSRTMRDIARTMDDVLVQEATSAALPANKLVAPPQSAAFEQSTNNIDRSVVVNFNNCAPIDGDFSLEQIAQRLGKHIFKEERARGLAYL
jgi:hypothetical protein